MSEQSKPIQPIQIQLIPLNKLSASKYDVRKANRKADIDALAAAIAAQGLQNLSIIPNGRLRGACMQTVRCWARALGCGGIGFCRLFRARGFRQRCRECCAGQD
jgi:hypothetical protein